MIRGWGGGGRANHFLEVIDWMHKKVGPSGRKGSWSLKPRASPWGDGPRSQLMVKTSALRGADPGLQAAGLSCGLGILLTQLTRAALSLCQLPEEQT